MMLTGQAEIRLRHIRRLEARRLQQEHERRQALRAQVELEAAPAGQILTEHFADTIKVEYVFEVVIGDHAWNNWRTTLCVI